MQTELGIEQFDGALVRAIRIRQGLTVRAVARQAAAMVGVWEEAKQSRLELNKQRPTGEDLAVLKAILQVQSIDEFFRKIQPATAGAEG